MNNLKFGLEKPAFIWFMIVVLYTAVFWFALRETSPSDAEQATYNIMKQFAESSFPPRIALIREVPDWGHLGFYAIFGRIFSTMKGDLTKLRMIGMVMMFAAFFVFIRLGHLFTYRNRLNPLWVSLSTVILAVNPYSWLSAFHLGYTGVLLLLMLIAMYFFKKEQIGWAAIFTSFAVLVDWRALLLALAFVLTRIIAAESSRLIRAERMLAFVLPFIVGILPPLAWHGLVPQGEATEWWQMFREHAAFFRLDGLFYFLALLPIYGIWFSWSWAIRARSRALMVGAISTAVLVPLYFVFPIRFDAWNEIRYSTEVPLGIIDEGAVLIAGQYKNLILFIPWLAGSFLFAQLVLMDVLDRSRWLRYFVILFFVAQPFLIGVGDSEFLILLPSVLLLSLSEALVGEEGKLA